MSKGVLKLPESAIREAESLEMTPEQILLLVDLIFLNKDPRDQIPS